MQLAPHLAQVATPNQRRALRACVQVRAQAWTVQHAVQNVARPHALRTRQARQHVVTHAEATGAGTTAWYSETEVHDDASMKAQEALLERFRAADTDGNGVIDKEELWTLLESTGGGLQQPDGEHWMEEVEVDRVMRQYNPSGTGVLSFDQFAKLTADGILLSGMLDDYRVAFSAVDSGGNGRISATELAQLFESLGTPLSYDRLVKVMAKYDLDNNNQIDFYEFLRMFRDDLLDLKEILDYIKMQPRPMTDDEKKALAAAARRGPGLVVGTVNMLFSEVELNTALEAAGDHLVVLMASLTWCRPCKAFTSTYEKISNRYDDVYFLKFNGNENDDTKDMFKNRLKARVTPTYYFFKNGKQIHCHTGANKSRLEHYVRMHAGSSSLPKSLYPPYNQAAPEPVGKA